MLRSGLTRLPDVGDRVDRYRIVAEIAHGGMAAVFAAQRADAGTFEKVLAIKFLLPHLASERRFVDMFLDEARIAAQIQHPNVVQVFDVGEHRGAPFIVMEYLRGQSLAAVLRRCWLDDATVSRETLYFVLAEVARGLAGAHAAEDSVGEALDVVHRDVSPQNVHLGYDGRVRVVDFGVAAAAGRITSTRTGEIKGKLAFLAPEQLHRRHPVDHRTDLWAFGVMCWEIFAGERLFRGETDSDTMYNVLHKTVPAIGTLAPELPAELATCIDRCLKRAAIQRPSSAERVAETFAAAAHGVSTETLAELMRAQFGEERDQEEERVAAALRAEPSEPTLAATTPRRRWPYVAGSLALGLAGLTIWWASSDDPAQPMVHAAAPEPEPIIDTEEPVAETLPETIELTVDERARLVLVDGVRHQQRPLQLQVSPGEHREVVLVGARGEERFSVDVDDDGRELRLPPRTTMRRVEMQPAKTPAKMRSSPLFEVDI